LLNVTGSSAADVRLSVAANGYEDPDTHGKTYRVTAIPLADSRTLGTTSTAERLALVRVVVGDEIVGRFLQRQRPDRRFG
jgi:hypothetical protein